MERGLQSAETSDRPTRLEFRTALGHPTPLRTEVRGPVSFMAGGDVGTHKGAAPRRPVNEVTRILDRAHQGDPKAAEELLPLVYDELRKLAAARMAQESPGQTLQPTALVHEAWLRLVGNAEAKFEGRAHFFAAAAEAMRRILIDHARRKRALRHGGGQVRLDIDDVELAAAAREDELLAVQDALDKLAGEDTGLAELVKLRFFVGLTNRETAEVLGVSEPTVERRWAFARAWLHREIQSRS